MYILCQELAYKHKNYGQVGTINLDRLDAILETLKTHWKCSNDIGLVRLSMTLTSAIVFVRIMSFNSL